MLIYEILGIIYQSYPQRKYLRSPVGRYQSTVNSVGKVSMSLCIHVFFHCMLLLINSAFQKRCIVIWVFRTLLTIVYHGHRLGDPNQFDRHDVKCNDFPRYWSFVKGIHRSSVVSLTKVSNAELWCFQWSAEQTIRAPVIWDAIALIMTPL